MHTGSKLDGRVCKCMDCAKARSELRVSIAWERDGKRMASATLAVARAEANLNAAQRDLKTANALFKATVDHANEERITL